MARSAKTRTGVFLYKVEGGISGSIHHRGPTWYLTEEEAQAACDAANPEYQKMHPAAWPQAMLGVTAVDLPPFVLPTLRRGAIGGGVDRQGVPYPRQIGRGEQAKILRKMGLVRDVETDSYPYIEAGLTRLARQLLAANPVE